MELSVGLTGVCVCVALLVQKLPATTRLSEPEVSERQRFIDVTTGTE